MNPERALRQYVTDLLGDIPVLELMEIADTYGVDIVELDGAYRRAVISISFEEKR